MSGSGSSQDPIVAPSKFSLVHVEPYGKHLSGALLGFVSDQTHLHPPHADRCRGACLLFAHVIKIILSPLSLSDDK